jgi:hypothetical protein
MPRHSKVTSGAGTTSHQSAPTSITITEPATEAVTAGGSVAVAGVSLTDTGIASQTALTLTISVESGTLLMGSSPTAETEASGSKTITVTDTLAHLNADLTSLIYAAGMAAGQDTISFIAASGATSGSGQIAVTVAATSAQGGSDDESTYLETHNFLAANSPWNTPIEPSVTYSQVPALASLPSGLVNWSSGGATTAIYYAQSSDPTVQVFENPNTWEEVNTGAWARWDNSAAIEKQIMSGSTAINPFHYNPYSTQVAGGDWREISSGITAYNQSQPLYFHVPVNALPAADGDGQTVVIQPDGMAVEMYSPILLSNGNWVAMMYSETNALSGQGTGADNGRRASETPNYAGTIRDVDIQQGAINHAIALLVPQTILAPSYGDVAQAFDSGNNGYSGTLPMGSLLALPASTNIAAMGLQTTLGQEIAKAAQTYGMYVVDKGGSGISLSVQDNPTEPALANYSYAEQQDINAVIHSLLLVHQ